MQATLHELTSFFQITLFSNEESALSNQGLSSILFDFFLFHKAQRV